MDEVGISILQKKNGARAKGRHLVYKSYGYFVQLTLSGYKLMNWLCCISVTSKMLRMKSQFDHLLQKHIISLFTHFNTVFITQFNVYPQA